MRDKRRKARTWPVLLLLPLVLVGCGRRNGHDHDDDRPSHNSASVRPTEDDQNGPGIGDLPVPDIEINGGETAPGETAGTETQAAPEPEPEPTDPTEEAFRAVAQGTCLPVYRNGSGWNVAVPPASVSCGDYRAGVFRVTYTSTDDTRCPTGTGQDSWSHHSTITGNSTTLCLNRIWVKDYCVLAQQSGDVISSIGASTAVDCGATQVPLPYNQVLLVAAVYQAPPGTGADNCRTSAYDAHRYWSLIADDGNTLVCFTSRY